MSLLFRACLGFLIAFAAVQPRALLPNFGPSAIASLKVDLAEAERTEAARVRTPFDAAIVRAGDMLRAAARVKEPKI